MKKDTLNSTGFTIIELMIASAVFSMVLLLCTLGLLQLGKMYYKGVTTVRVQEVARSTIEEISRPIQFGSNAPGSIMTKVYGSAPNAVTVNSFCIGNKRYSYALKLQVSDSVTDGTFDASNSQIRHALWRDTTDDASCTPLDLRLANPSSSDATSKDSEELLGAGMRLASFSLSAVTGTSDAYQIDIKIVLGDDDLLNAAHTACQPNVSGSEYCATSSLTTVVTRRLS